MSWETVGRGHEKGRPNGGGSEGCTEQVILELSLEGQEVFTKFGGTLNRETVTGIQR